jgi:hypothetical protein
LDRLPGADFRITKSAGIADKPLMIDRSQHRGLRSRKAKETHLSKDGSGVTVAAPLRHLAPRQIFG